MSNFKSDSKSKEKPKICSVEEALRLHEGYVRVSGAIAGVTGTYKMIKSATKRCNCRGKSNYLEPYDPPINQWDYLSMNSERHMRLLKRLYHHLYPSSPIFLILQKSSFNLLPANFKQNSFVHIRM